MRAALTASSGLSAGTAVARVGGMPTSSSPSADAGTRARAGRSCLATTLAVLLSSPASMTWAQVDVPVPPPALVAPGPLGEEATPPSEPLPPPEPEPEHDDGRRVAAQLGLGFLVFAGATGLGILIGGAAARGTDTWGDAVVAAFTGTVAGHAIGYLLYPAVVTAVGDARGGRGTAGAAYLGALIGGAIYAGFTSLAGLLVDPHYGSDAILFAVGGASLVAALVAPVLAYELSDDAASEPAVAPTVSVGPNQAVVGVTGRF
jgi:hypothetical protein